MEVQNVSGYGPDAASAALASGLRERSVGRAADQNAAASERTTETGNETKTVQTDSEASVVRARSTHLYVDPESKQIVAQIMDENKKLIKQIPPEEMLKIAARFEEINGKLFDQNV